MISRWLSTCIECGYRATGPHPLDGKCPSCAGQSFMQQDAVKFSNIETIQKNNIPENPPIAPETRQNKKIRGSGRKVMSTPPRQNKRPSKRQIPTLTNKRHLRKVKQGVLLGFL